MANNRSRAFFFCNVWHYFSLQGAGGCRVAAPVGHAWCGGWASTSRWIGFGRHAHCEQCMCMCSIWMMHRRRGLRWQSRGEVPATRNRRKAQLSLRAPRAVVDTCPLLVSSARLRTHTSVFTERSVCALLLEPRSFSRKLLVCEWSVFICSIRKLVKCYCLHTDQRVRFALHSQTSWGTARFYFFKVS